MKKWIIYPWNFMIYYKTNMTIIWNQTLSARLLTINKIDCIVIKL